MNKFYSALVAIAAVAMLVPASAQDVCYTTSDPQVTIDGSAAGEPTRYIINDDCQPDCIFSIWGYDETNGIDGLQRDDDFASDVEACEGTVKGDIYFF